MKISNIVFYNRFAQQAKVSKAHNNFENINSEYNATPLEFLGRSQVTFQGNSIKLNADDKKFIDVVSRDLRFSDNRKKQFGDVVQEYLKENNLNSLDDINSEDCNEQAYFLTKVSEEMDLSDAEFDVLNFHIIDRIFSEGIYLPEDRRFIKDLPIIEPILEQYGLDEEAVEIITDTMLIDADNLDCETLFDIFSKHTKEFENMLFYNALSDAVDDDECINIYIDLCLKAKQYEQEGENIFPKHNEKVKFYNSLDDEFITDNIIETFKIDENEGENIFKHIIKRHGEATFQQIAFEIADEYSLPAKADKEIIEIIKNQKSLSEKLKKFED